MIDEWTENRRQYPRFTDPALRKIPVTVELRAPVFGDSVAASLVDLSAGGMALAAPDVIPRKVLLKLSLVLPDGFPIHSVITVRHVARQKRHTDFVHGIQFLSLSPEMIERIDRLAADILACAERQAAGQTGDSSVDTSIDAGQQREESVASEIIAPPTPAEIDDFFRNAA